MVLWLWFSIVAAPGSMSRPIWLKKGRQGRAEKIPSRLSNGHSQKQMSAAQTHSGRLKYRVRLTAQNCKASSLLNNCGICAFWLASA